MCSVLQSITFYLSIVLLSDGQCPSNNKLKLIDFNDLIVLAIGLSVVYILYDSNYKNKPFIKVVRKARVRLFSILRSAINSLANSISSSYSLEQAYLIPKIKFYIPKARNDKERKLLSSTLKSFERWNRVLAHISSSLYSGKRAFSTSFFNLSSFDCVFFSFLLLWLSALDKKIYIYGRLEWMMIVVFVGVFHCFLCKYEVFENKTKGLLLIGHAVSVSFLLIVFAIYGYPIPFLPIDEDLIVIFAVSTCYLNFLSFLFVFLFFVFHLYEFSFLFVMQEYIHLKIKINASRVKSVKDIIADLEKKDKKSFEDSDFDYSYG